MLESLPGLVQLSRVNLMELGQHGEMFQWSREIYGLMSSRLVLTSLTFNL